MLTVLRRLIFVVPAMLLAACASKPVCDKDEPHLTARPGPEIELPAAPARSPWAIPGGPPGEARGDARRRADGSCLEEPPVYLSSKEPTAQ
jgi:hypothetical protein